MSRSYEVSSILAQRHKLKDLPGITIKPDMSLADRKIDYILMKQRWDLIQSGVQRDQIKIKGNVIMPRCACASEV